MSRRWRVWAVFLAILATLASASLAQDDDASLSDFRDPVFQREALTLARHALERWVRGGAFAAPGTATRLHPALLRQAGVFVSLDLPDGRIRGCRGTLQPRVTRLADEIVANVREAALRDPLHPPVRPSELGRLRIILCVPGHATQAWPDEQWDTHETGLLIESGDRAAVMLPYEAPDADRMRQWALKRAGIAPGEPVRMLRFQAVRFAEVRDLRPPSRPRDM